MLLRNLATALLEHGKIQTTLAKAKEVQPFTEKLITLAKDGWNLDHFRRSLAVLTSKDVSVVLLETPYAGESGQCAAQFIAVENAEVRHPNGQIAI